MADVAKMVERSRPISPGFDRKGEEARAMDQRRRARVLATSTVKTPDGDIWRGSLLRYAGYANEVGESFRNIAPRAVVPSYAISVAYVCGDTVDKAYKEHSAGKGHAAVAKMGVDVLLWQMLATVAVPGLIINFTVKGVTALMKGSMAKQLPRVVRKWTPTVVGLGIIPLIVTPIDDGVTWAMDETIRIWLQTGKPNQD